MNLLTDPLFEVSLPDGTCSRYTAPQILARLARDDIVSFGRLQQHQEQAWYCFLVQLASMAISRTDLRGFSDSAEDWQRALRALASGSGDEPWQLVVDDLAAPAFMQPPVPEGNIEVLKAELRTPAALDVLVTSKNHDVKALRLPAPSPEHWAYALVTLQTMHGVLGAGKYGISRMNGGYGNRPWVGLMPDHTWGGRFRRDVKVLLRERMAIVDRQGYDPNGVPLLWCVPWDGGSPLPLARLDPFFIEICRRVRLVGAHGEIAARGVGSKKARIEAKQYKGNVGDPWTPVRTGDGASLTVGQTGFDYRLTRDLILGTDYTRAPCQQVVPADRSGVLFSARAMARGQGKTEGLHERHVRIPSRVCVMLGSAGGGDALDRLSKDRADAAGVLQQKVLKPAVLCLVQGAPNRINFRDERARDWLRLFNARVDGVFFPLLWRDCELGELVRQERWAEELRAIGQDVLSSASESVPIPGVRRYRTVATAERIFGGAFYRSFPFMRPNKEGGNAHV